MGFVIVLCDGFAVCRSAHGLGSSVQGAGDLGCSDSVLDVSDHVALDDQVPVELFLELYRNVNGSYCSIEGITSPDGRVLGKMAHSERRDRSVAMNIYGEQDLKIFESGVAYFK